MKINMTGANSRSETANPFGTPVFTSVFSGVRVAPSLVVCIVFCKPFTCIVLLSYSFAHVFSVLSSSRFSPQS